MFKVYCRAIATCLLAFLVSSCASTSSLSLKPQTRITTLGIDFQVNPYLPGIIQSQMNRHVDDFIVLYNSQNHLFKVDRANEKCGTCLKIRMVGMQLVNSSQQTTGAIVSSLGLSLPFVMVGAGAHFFVAFWYFPKTISLSEVTLSEDIANSAEKVSYRISSPGFLKSPIRQIETHADHLQKYLGDWVNSVETSQKKIR